MVKILAQAGRSLADVYDVEGSVAGIEQLETRELPIVHEMGGTVFSEQLTGTVRIQRTGALSQSTTWDHVITDLPSGITRILGVNVIAEVTARTESAQVSVRSDNNDLDFPIWEWHTSADFQLAMRVNLGSGSVNNFLLRPVSPLIGNLPSMLFGAGQPHPSRVDRIAFRGSTSAFGAGTVIIALIVLIGFTQTTSLSNVGLPVPSW